MPTYTHTHRHRHRQTHRQTHRHRHTDRHTDRHAHAHMHTHVLPGVQDLVGSLLRVNPTERFTAQEVQLHPWIIGSPELDARQLASPRRCVEGRWEGEERERESVCVCVCV